MANKARPAHVQRAVLAGNTPALRRFGRAGARARNAQLRAAQAIKDFDRQLELFDRKR